jgi:hypothetical protein
MSTTSNSSGLPGLLEKVAHKNKNKNKSKKSKKSKSKKQKEDGDVVNHGESTILEVKVIITACVC